MKNALYLSLAAFLSIGIALLSGCDKNTNPAGSTGAVDTLTANSKVQQAYTEMESQMYFMATNSFNNARDLDRLDFSRANTLYREALQADPNNAAANLGGALTEVLMVYADPVVNDAVKRWEGANLGKKNRSAILNFGIPTGTKDMGVPVEAAARNMAKIIQTALNDPPTISEMQAILRDRLLPRLQYAIARLAVVEQNQAFQFKITGKMQGNNTLQPVYLDLTEVYLMDALVYGMKAMVDEFLVFQFELPSYTTKAAVEAIQQTNTTFFVLASDGATRSANVKSDLLSVISKIRSAVNFLKSETGNQSDDVIKRAGPGVSGGIATSDLDTVLSYLTTAEKYLNTAVTVTLYASDTDLNNYTIQVNLSQLFTNPPANPKLQWLPTYTVDTTARGDIMWHWQAQEYASFNFPDPTFGGLFPGMTNETLKRILYIDEAFGWNVSVWVSTYNYYNPIPSATTASLVVNGKTYYPKPNRYDYYYGWGKEFNFIVLDNANLPAQLNMAFSGVVIPLQMTRTPVVRLKEHDYIDAYMDLAPQNVTGQAMVDYWSGQPYASINFNQSGTYLVEKDSTNGGSFSRIDSVYLYSSYSDYKVTHGKTYWYRAQYLPFYPYYWSYGIQAWRANNTTNTVSISIP